MARLASAEWNPAGATPGGYMDPRVVIFHVTAGEGMAQPHSGLEWHFHVAYDGSVRQLVDTNQQAAANYKANPFAISIETEGLGDGEWTRAQLDSLLMISEWCLAHHPKIRRQRCDRWDGSGFGYHVMFGAPGPWTPVAKSCPGPRRIRQFEDVLLPRILRSEEDDMYDAAARNELVVRLDELRTESDANWSRLVELERFTAWAGPVLAELAGRDGVDIDGAEVARLVLAGLGDVVLSSEQVRSIIDAMPQAVKQALREGAG